MLDPVQVGSTGGAAVVSAERAERLIKALSLVAVGEFEAAGDLLPSADGADDGSLSLETCVRVVIDELAEAQAANARAVARLEDSARQLAERMALIERQRVALVDLSTPLIEVGDATLVLPVIGAVDGERAQVMGERLLNQVQAQRIRRAILDLTGMTAEDAASVDNLLRLSHGVALLGARVTLTGPALARTLVALGLDLRGLDTRRTLEDGLRAGGRAHP
ncbi:MAG: STAS domain-containing protein [Myxococcales bacterium]|nr:STAS domain-containing protein [Myxococcales bacterium]